MPVSADQCTFSVKTYPPEYLGGGFLDFPRPPVKAVPNKLRRSLGLALSKLPLALLWVLGNSVDSSLELRLVEVKEMVVEVVSFSFSPVSREGEPLDSNDRPNIFPFLLFLLLPVLRISPCEFTSNQPSEWFENRSITHLAHGCSIVVKGNDII